MFRLGETSINANSRSYYLHQALELTGEIHVGPVAQQSRRAYAMAMPIERFFTAMPIWLNPTNSATVTISSNVHIVDVEQWFIVKVRKGVEEIRRGKQARVTLTGEVAVLQELLLLFQH